MRFDGEWLQCDDEIVRPVVRAEILGGDGVWRAFELLVDTGADRTVISANVLAALNIESIQPQQQLAGAGGRISSVIIKTPLRLTRDDGEKTLFRGEYHACTAPEDLDMSVLGRDILALFALIVDKGDDVVAIIGGHHHYTIHQ